MKFSLFASTQTMLFCSSIIATLWFSQANAFQWKTAGKKCMPGQRCSYSYAVEEDVEPTKVEAYCAPNGWCADNGARCSSDDECFGWCSGGICGGLGSICNTQISFVHNPIYWDYACFTPQFECSSHGELGVCKPAGKSGQIRKPFSKRSVPNHELDTNSVPVKFSHEGSHNAMEGDQVVLGDLHSEKERTEELQYSSSKVASRSEADIAWSETLQQPATKEDRWKRKRLPTPFEIFDGDDEEVARPTGHVNVYDKS